MAYGNRGSAWAIKGENDRAVKDFKKCLELLPDAADAAEVRKKIIDLMEK